MTRPAWKSLQARSLQHAMELCIEYGRKTHNLSVDRIAERMGLENKWVIYKWMQSARIPVLLVQPFERACDCPYKYVTRFLALSGELLTIPMPTGRKATARDIQTLQQSLNHATGALIKFANGEADSDITLAALNQAMQDLAWHHVNVTKSEQPELEFACDE